MFDGDVIEEVLYKKIRSSVSLVSQDPMIFSANALDNIRYGRLTATDNEVIQAAKAANAHDFISDLPEAYNSFLGEKGVRLSGGQKQRIAIARALASKPKVLLADEPTGALDSTTSEEVMGVIKKINSEGKTILVVTHEQDIANMCKRIITLKDGIIMKDIKTK